MPDCSLCVLQTETKPVQMMNLEATFCLGYVKELNVAILELPCLNKHISMLILLPKEIEDETTGLEKVREKIRTDMILPLETARLSYHMPMEGFCYLDAIEKEIRRKFPVNLPSRSASLFLISYLSHYYFHCGQVRSCEQDFVSHRACTEDSVKSRRCS